MNRSTDHERIRGVTRRAFLGSGAAGATLLASVWPRMLSASGAAASKMADEAAPWFEAAIPQLQSLMASGDLTSRDLTLAYLARIDRLNPLLNAVIETNPNAVSIAARLDAERRAGRLRGPLHGIPVLVKDNIATGDTMQTTAGSMALVGSRPPGDAPVVARLREAGAVILGKANLSEWANWRSLWSATSGWSARGGLTMNPYLLSWDSSGSSSGSAVGAAANLCAGALGTETDGSIVGPAGNNMVVGLKPSVGLVPQGGIIPIAHSQDTAGPIARTVTDVAILLGAIQAPFGRAAGFTPPPDYTAFLDPGALAGARIGYDGAFFGGGLGPFEPGMSEVAYAALDVMRSAGATVVDISGTLDLSVYFDPELVVFFYEFKAQIAEYLATLTHTSMRTLADLIAFNESHCWQEMRYFGQDAFELCEQTSGDLHDPVYLEALGKCLQAAPQMDAALRQVDAIVAPSWTWFSSPPAVSGYPNLSIPVGMTEDGRPVGLWIAAGFLEESKLIAYGYALEQALRARVQPGYAGAPRTMAEAGICTAGKPHAWYGGMGRPRGPFKL